VLFGAGLVGATRLPDGKTRVADRGDYSLKLFARDGKLVKKLGRKGEGPAEFGYLARMYRCGDQILTWDIQNGYRVTVFDLDMRATRAFRFSYPSGAGGTYASACNAASTFIHYGWANVKTLQSGVHRGAVDVWTTGADSGIKQIIGQIPGSERWGFEHGTRPLPLGKQPVVAISGDRIFIGTADTYEIAVHNLAGRRIGSIRQESANLATSKSDIDFAMEREQAGQTDAAQKRIAAEYATIEFPKTVPAYDKMLVDADGLLWVEDYPRGKSATRRWTVFSGTGVKQAEVGLPVNLEVFEIGHDYLLGKYIDPDEQIPEVRMYKLSRSRKP
jgi:hypothetical protein